MRNSMPAMVLGVLSLGVGLLPGALAQNTGPTATAGAVPRQAATPAMTGATTPSADRALTMGSGRIAYKQDNNNGGLGGLFLRLAGSLVLMTALAFAVAVLAKRYVPGIRGYSADGKSRIQLLESKRVTPKLTLFVVEYEGKRLLLAQSGDRVVEIGTQRE